MQKYNLFLIWQIFFVSLHSYSMLLLSMKQVTLRALEPEDIDYIFRWENDSKVWEWSIAHTPFSRHALTQYILDCSQVDIYTSKQLRLVAEALDTSSQSKQAVGCIDLYDFDPFHRRANMGILIDCRCRHHGYGAAMLSEFLDFCHHNLQLHQLYCEIAETNTDCLQLFEHHGFERQGMLRDWIFSHDSWTNAVMLSRLLD